VKSAVTVKYCTNITSQDSTARRLTVFAVCTPILALTESVGSTVTNLRLVRGAIMTDP
jgi:hypothetical protein